MDVGNLTEVHVDDLAAFEILVVEMDDDEGRFSYERKELLLNNLRVGTVSINLVHLLLFEVFFFRLEAFFLHSSLDLVLVFVFGEVGIRVQSRVFSFAFIF